MLTADLVRARRRKGELQVLDLTGDAKQDAIDVAALLIGTFEEHVGKTRDELEGALEQILQDVSERRVGDGLVKLLEDRSDFETGAEGSPEELRREVFEAAARARRGEGDRAAFDRAAVLAEVAERRGVTAEQVDMSLFADLRGCNVLRGFSAITPEALVDVYHDAQPQAVLLRAVRVVVNITCASAASYRAFFKKLKFLRLLYEIERLDTGYRVVIEGPFSMFDAVTKYGLKLAMLLPALEGCDGYSLEADVRWGKEREPLVFRRKGGGSLTGDAAPGLSDEVAALMKGLKALPSLWKVSASTALLDLPGVGLCVPDLVCEHRSTGEKIYIEVMGFWSRDAVWKRVELVERGLGDKIVFAVSERLRVSEQVLGDDAKGALYVYKGVMSPKVLLERLERLRARAG